MKVSACIVVILISLTATVTFAQDGNPDTIFISKDSILRTAQSIFIDNNKQSKVYDNIANFKFGEFDDDSFRMSLENLKESKLTLKKRQPVIVYTHWVPLYLYNGEFYTYSPCDYYHHHTASFNDSCFIDWTGEGPLARKIIEQKKKDEKTYSFKLTGGFGNEWELVIHIIDKEKGIAVFEDSGSGGKKKYYTMIATEKMRTVPLIVNECEIHKQFELKFEKPDYAELLKTK